MTEHPQCKCKLDCAHHKGKPCLYEAIVLPTEHLVENGEYEEGPPVLLGYCEKCLAANQCPECKGRGKIGIPQPLRIGEDAGIDIKQETCSACNGTGISPPATRI